MKMTHNLQFFLALLTISVTWSLAIFLKETTVQAQVNFFHVLVWQALIWFFWVLLYLIHRKISRLLNKQKSSKKWLLLWAILAVSIHYIWFFTVCQLISPYLGFPHTKYGVYPYFFIFWTLLDIALMAALIMKPKDDEVKSPTTEPQWLSLKRGKQNYVLKPDEINWLSAENYYTKLYTTKGEFLERKPMKYFQKLLPPDMFVRIHRSTMVNIDQICSLEKDRSGGKTIKLADGNVRKISRTQLKRVQKAIAERCIDTID
ncbi:LytR/AlgR family response regulator transcription factor [Marinicella meishanensis]|uniref:LytR/AlgR family response regulator transcription factor n=1 Tax=Marinicella meishanensis TaxID=2873263 RepID=UPI001CC06EF7|nr:LytTR family DNA-binding domain-containing protein [Marinicella sp. NBU2979]